MPKLTKKIVDAALPREKQYTVWCSELKGFGVYVQPSGAKTYFVDYRVDSARRRMTIGRHGTITADEARKLAIETLGGIVLQKGDPLLERKTRRASLTVAELCDQYMKAAEKGLILGRRKNLPKKASTIEVDRGRIARHIKPLLGSRLVIDLARADITKFMRDVSAGKTARKDRSGVNGARVEVKGGTGTAARTTGLLGGILTYAVDEGIIPTSPALGVKLPADGVRTRRLLPDEYKALGKALSGTEAEYDTPQAVTGAWLLALTGCRLGEIAALRWEEVDEAGGCFRLEDSKSGPSVRPVGREAFDVLRKAQRVSGNPFVLPATRMGGLRHYNGLAGAWVRFMTRAGLEGVTPHTMRHSFASVAGDLGFADSTIAAMLGHAGGTVTSKYVHRLDSVLVAAANKVCGEAYRQMTGATAKVLEMPRRA
ncbi:tyrosine-type recombinase/integrase [Mesorhizobium sp. A556]